MFSQPENRFMQPQQNLSKKKNATIPDEVERAKYWADLLYEAPYKYDIYIIAKNNLDNTNKN